MCDILIHSDSAHVPPLDSVIEDLSTNQSRLESLRRELSLLNTAVSDNEAAEEDRSTRNIETLRSDMATVTRTVRELRETIRYREAVDREIQSRVGVDGQVIDDVEEHPNGTSFEAVAAMSELSSSSEGLESGGAADIQDYPLMNGTNGLSNGILPHNEIASPFVSGEQSWVTERV